MFSGLNMTNQAYTLNETNSVLKQHHLNVVFIYLENFYIHVRQGIWSVVFFLVVP